MVSAACISFFLSISLLRVVLRKADKASLSNKLPEENRNMKADDEMTVIDFMALVRKLPLKKMTIDTFGQLAESPCNNILVKGSASTRIYIVFDVFQKSSIKEIERAQRSSTKQITLTIRLDNQKVPVDLDMFWSSVLKRSDCKSISSIGCCKMLFQKRSLSLVE